MQARQFAYLQTMSACAAVEQADERLLFNACEMEVAIASNMNVW
jgi:hypothetical protein